MAETISSVLPAWLQKRASPFETSSTQQDLQAGFQMAQQVIQNNRQLRALQLQEEARRLALDEKERVAQGAVEVTRVLAEMGQSGDYTSPALQSKFWDAVSKNPKFATSPAFKDILDTFQNAEQAKARAALEQTRQQAITDRSDSAIQSRFDLLTQRLDSMTQLEGVKQDGRTALAELKNELNMLRDQLKPTRPGEIFHDLSEADLAQMKSDLAALDKMYEKGRIKGKGGGLFSNDPKTTPEQEYQAERAAIQKKYEAKRTSAPRPAPEPAKQDDFKAMYDALPSGAEYTDPNGVKRIKR